MRFRLRPTTRAQRCNCAAPLSLTETVEIASTLVPMQLEEFEQVMRERE